MHRSKKLRHGDSETQGSVHAINRHRNDITPACHGVQSSLTLSRVIRNRATALICTYLHSVCQRQGKHAPADIEALPGVGGRGFLWGPLAVEGAARPFDWPDRRSGKCNASESASNASAAGAIVVEIPSLSGTSNLSSGVISGLRRTLVWADSDVGVCTSTVSRFALLDQLPIGRGNMCSPRCQ